MSIAASILIGVTVIAVFCVLVVMLMDLHDLMADLREMDGKEREREDRIG